MSWPERIEINPQVLAGKPVIKGTRLAVELVLEMVGAGVSIDEILANYPGLTREDIDSCLAPLLSRSYPRRRGAGGR